MNLTGSRGSTDDAGSPASPSGISVFSPGGVDQVQTPFTLPGSDHSSPTFNSSPASTPVEKEQLQPPDPEKIETSVITVSTEGVSATEPSPEVSPEEEDDDFNDLSMQPYFREFSPHDQVDPFNQLPVRVSSQIHLVLQHGLKIYRFSGNNYKLAYLPEHIRDNINQFPIADVIQRSIHQPHHLYAFLACLSIRMQKIFREDIQEQAPISFRRHASHHLRKELIKSGKTGVVDRHTILDILFLVVSETATGEYESARKHLRVVAKLYHLLDLTQHFDHWISESCAHVDNQLALSTGKPPTLPQDFDPGPLLPERRAALQREIRWLLQSGVSSGCWHPSPVSLTVRAAPLGLRDAIADLSRTMDLRMGSMFDHGLRKGMFSDALAGIVTDIVECVAIAKVVWLSPVAVCFDAEWLCRKARAVLRRLLKLAPENNIGPLDVVGKCMEVVRCTLLILMAHACTMIGFQTARLNVLKLQNALAFALKSWAPALGLTPELERVDNHPLPALVQDQLSHILFNTMVGVFAADLPGYEGTETFFMVRVLNLCNLLGIHSYDDLREHMVKFLYSPVLQEPSVLKVAAKLEAREHMRPRASL
ncbi:uncharacterized protein HMPREF1541_00300 [Cyphellophora europaea CBS 101466]|uniref:Transcription factor domain-containing protein n=1 Tax=Cyphellophora europaea (strain CBS 101466) TaxID=1220924 RepID=W2SBK5_CYPE1|nr:uncharacterized protein HMPREF1541_00300 [Cyphellophora europaea CBS 101466]ETN46116.1 hypothetical protein HMPREF1541_00300 [Cyphellophora europaea CBS 101466]